MLRASFRVNIRCSEYRGCFYFPVRRLGNWTPSAAAHERGKDIKTGCRERKRRSDRGGERNAKTARGKKEGGD